MIDPALLAGRACEDCGAPATCGVVDMVESRPLKDADGTWFHPRFGGEHSTHWFCEFHERPGRVVPRASR